MSNKVTHRGFVYQVRVINYYRPLTTIPEVQIAIQPEQSFDSAIRYKISLDSEIVKEATGFFMQKIEQCINTLFNFLLMKTCDVCGHFEDVGISPDYIVDHQEFFDFQGKQICKHCLNNAEKVINNKLSAVREEILKEEIGHINIKKDKEKETNGLKVKDKPKEKLKRTGTFALIPENIIKPVMEVIEEVQEFKYIFVLTLPDGIKKIALYKEKKMSKVALEVQKKIYSNRFKTNEIEVIEDIVKKPNV